MIRVLASCMAMTIRGSRERLLLNARLVRVLADDRVGYRWDAGWLVIDPARMLWQMIKGDGPGYLQFRWRYDGGLFEPESPFHVPAQWVGPTFVRSDLDATCLRLFGLADCSVGAVPRQRPDARYLAGANVLWARLETGKHAEALARFRPAPSLVLREGKSPRRVALWALSSPLSLSYLERANRRLAHRLGTKKKWGAAEFEFHPVGTELSFGRESRPNVVWAEHVDAGSLFVARGVVGHLQEAPDPRSWMKEAAA